MRKWELAAAVLGVATCLLSAGCGGTKESEKRPTAAQVQDAEKVARENVPAIPIWEKASFHGVATEDGDVCVDRTYARSSAKLLGGDRNAGYVVVTIPEMKTSKPRNGRCQEGSAQKG